MRKRLPTPPTSRRGTVLVIVVVLLLVTASIAGAVMRAALLDARQFTIDRNALQADRIAEAGLDRASMRLNVDPNYDGETWTAPLPNGETGSVVLRLTGDGQQRTLEATATYPAESERPVRSTRRMTR
ncbi:MAG: hypothetical protein WBC44_08995 [Planctomycetaceae bacterium]